MYDKIKSIWQLKGIISIKNATYIVRLKAFIL